MIRITELPLPLDYTPEALRQAIVKRLKIRDAELLSHTLFKRSYDARKKNTGILFICIVDVKLADEDAVLRRFAKDRQISAVRSVENESTMRISSHQRSDSMHSAMFCSSLRVVTIAEIAGRVLVVAMARQAYHRRDSA